MQCKESYCYNNVELVPDKQIEIRNGFYCSNSIRLHKKPNNDASGGLSENSGEYSNHFFPLKPAEHGFCIYCKKRLIHEKPEEVIFEDPFKAIAEASRIGDSKVCWHEKWKKFVIIPAIETKKDLQELLHCFKPGIKPTPLCDEGEEMLLKI